MDDSDPFPRKPQPPHPSKAQAALKDWQKNNAHPPNAAAPGTKKHKAAVVESEKKVKKYLDAIAKEQDYFIIDKFPIELRPFYTMPDPENPVRLPPA